MTGINVDLLHRTLQHIEQHPEEWRQDAWRCGTTACFAGWAAILDGAQWAGEDHTADAEYILTDDPDRPVLHVQPYARWLLGLSWEQANDLFSSRNTLDDLRELVSELTEQASTGVKEPSFCRGCHRHTGHKMDCSRRAPALVG